MKLRDQIKKIILEQMSKSETSFYGINTNSIDYLLENPGFFSSLESKNEIKQWCEKHIGPKMGKGYSRLAFSMLGNNDLVFKVSYIGEEGNLTNKLEIENFTKFSFQNTFFPRVFVNDPAGEWFIVEKLNLLVGEEENVLDQSIMDRFDPYIRKNIKTLKSIEGLFRFFLQGEEEADEMYKLLIELPTQSSLGLDDGSNRIAYYYFDSALKLAWDKEAWRYDVVRDLQVIDIYDYFQGRHEAFLEKVCKRILRDPWMKKLSAVVKELDIDWGDIGPGNIGIDEQGNIKILDISIFDEKFAGSMFARSGTPVSWG